MDLDISLFVCERNLCLRGNGMIWHFEKFTQVIKLMIGESSAVVEVTRLTTLVCTVMNENDMHSYSTMMISLPDSVALECETRQQNTSNLWYLARSPRLISSSFKRICSRRADYAKACCKY